MRELNRGSPRSDDREQSHHFHREWAMAETIAVVTAAAIIIYYYAAIRN